MTTDPLEYLTARLAKAEAKARRDQEGPADATALRMVKYTREIMELHYDVTLPACPSCAEVDPEQRRPGWIVLNPCDTIIALAGMWGWTGE